LHLAARGLNASRSTFDNPGVPTPTRSRHEHDCGNAPRRCARPLGDPRRSPLRRPFCHRRHRHAQWRAGLESLAGQGDRLLLEVEPSRQNQHRLDHRGPRRLLLPLVPGRPATDDPPPRGRGRLLTAVTTIGGAIYATLAFAALALNAGIRTMSDDTFHHTVYRGLIRAADDASYMIHATGGAGASAMIFAATIAGMRARPIPGWAGWLGILAGLLALFSIIF